MDSHACITMFRSDNNQDSYSLHNYLNSNQRKISEANNHDLIAKVSYSETCCSPSSPREQFLLYGN